MKRKIFTFIALFCTLSIIMSVISSAADPSCLEWYIKRRVNSPPEYPEGADDLAEYNCYYIDKNCLNSGKKKIYITFDAGYENGNIAKILDVLKEENVPAAFFVLDNIILKNTDLVNRMAEEGHLVCNHTKRHKNLCASNKEEIKDELSALEAIYFDKTGREMSKFFRFPEGKYSIDAVKNIYELGYTTVFWSFGYDDWDNGRQMNPEKAKKKILSATHNGEIILLHPTSDTNAAIIRDLIYEWRKMGYTFGTLNDINSV